MSKFAEQFDGSRVIGFSGIFAPLKPSKINRLVIEANFGRPFQFGFIPRHAFVSTGIRCSNANVPFVLGACTFAKIAAAIIQSIMVTMIRFFPRLAAQYESVHITEHARNLTCSIVSATWFHYAPVPLIEPVVIVCVNERILPSRKRDNAIGWIRWLGNGMPLKSAFRHESSSKGFVLPSHFTAMKVGVQ